MTAGMMVALEREIVERQPDVVLLYGDTNSTLAGALVAAKLHVPAAHVEAGARTHSMTNPEEINRVCADHVSSLLLACTEGNLENLKSENLGGRSLFVGDPMYDAFLTFRAASKEPELVVLSTGQAVPCPKSFYYLTCHREENTGDMETLCAILDAMDELDLPVVYPVHPRNRRGALEAAREGHGKNVVFCEPVGYLESVHLVDHAAQVVTDSGGLQREAFFAEVKCTTVLDFEVWPETMAGGRNVLARPSKDSILEAMSLPQSVDASYLPFGDGDASRQIAEALGIYAKEAAR